MSVYEGTKTRVRVGCELSDMFHVKMGVHQGYVLSLLFVVVVDVVAELARGVLSELLYVDD